MLKLYNTLTRKKEVLKPIKGRRVGLYTCGPTVYWFAHIGNLRTYIFEDILKRVLLYDGYKIKHVMNVTDVGHLTSNADTGEDKIELGAKRERKTAWEIAEFYTQAFKNDLKALNVKEPDIWIKATDTIKEQIRLIKILEKKGFTYQIADGVYFDTSKLKTYGRLWFTRRSLGEGGPKKMKIKAGARVEMVPGKKNPTDFALWKFTPPGVKRQMEWDSPWGEGFPGWHTECVVMSAKYLGVPFDIHTGGIDHIPIHHTNEIAQSEAAFGEILARFWLHGEFLILKAGRMGKSERNIIRVEDLIKKGFNPLAYRYLCLTTHYRSKLSFSWLALKAAQNALDNLYEKVRELKSPKLKVKSLEAKVENYKKKFLDYISDDLNTPKAVALTWNLIKDKEISDKEKGWLLLEFDKVFGLNLAKVKKTAVQPEIKALIKKREIFRQQKNWLAADQIRREIKKKGYWVEDTKEGPKIKPIQ